MLEKIPDGSYVCVRIEKWISPNITIPETITGFIKNDDGVNFFLEEGKIIGGEKIERALFFNRKLGSFLNIEVINKK